MEKFSCWHFNNNHNIDSILDKIKNEQIKHRTDYTTKVLTYFDNDDFKKYSIDIFGVNIEYLPIKLHTHYDNPSSQDKYTNILFYEYENITKINIFRGKHNVVKYFREYFDAAQWGNIQEEDFEITEDLLYWMFKNFINTPEEYLSNDESIRINSLKGYRGITKDSVNSLQGDGDNICEILGTLAFLLNNDDLKMLRSNLTYSANGSFSNFLLEINLTKTYRFDLASYRGIFSLNPDYTDDHLKLLISIICSKFLIPKIVESYQYAVNNEFWSISIKRDFLMTIANRIQHRVKNEIEKLSLTIETQKVKQMNIMDYDFEENDSLIDALDPQIEYSDDN